MIDTIFLILSVLGSIASLIGLLTALNNHSKFNRILYGIIMLLSLTTVVVSVKYKNLTDEILDINNRKELARKEAKELLNIYNYYSFSTYEPGESQGVVYGVLTFLETHKNLFPESYSAYKQNVMTKISQLDKDKDEYYYGKQMAIAGETAREYLKSIAK